MGAGVCSWVGSTWPCSGPAEELKCYGGGVGPGGPSCVSRDGGRLDLGHQHGAGVSTNSTVCPFLAAASSELCREKGLGGVNPDSLGKPRTSSPLLWLVLHGTQSHVLVGWWRTHRWPPEPQRCVRNKGQVIFLQEKPPSLMLMFME